MFKLIFTILALIVGITTAQDLPYIKFDPNSALVGKSLNNLNGRFGVNIHVPVTKSFTIDGKYNRHGHMTGHRHTDSFSVFGQYRYKF